MKLEIIKDGHNPPESFIRIQIRLSITNTDKYSMKGKFSHKAWYNQQIYTDSKIIQNSAKKNHLK